MAELGIGVLFAIWFIVMYLLVSRWRKRDERFTGPVSLNPLDTSKLLGAQQQQQQKRFLTTEAMSEHHAQKKGNPSAESQR